MEKLVGDFYTEVVLTTDEAKGICKLGQGEECCAYLVLAPTSFECALMSSMGLTISDRLEEGTMVAKGEGKWEGCPWADES